jgi:hypothetical protein
MAFWGRSEWIDEEFTDPSWLRGPVKRLRAHPRQLKG